MTTVQPYKEGARFGSRLTFLGGEKATIHLSTSDIRPLARESYIPRRSTDWKHVDSVCVTIYASTRSCAFYEGRASSQCRRRGILGKRIVGRVGVSFPGKRQIPPSFSDFPKTKSFSLRRALHTCTCAVRTYVCTYCMYILFHCFTRTAPDKGILSRRTAYQLNKE